MRLRLEMLPQPNDTTCGPTCLHAVYNYYDDPIPLEQVVAEVPALREGGTLAVFLAGHALRRGYRATIYTYNLQLFDPTWFHHGHVDLLDKLQQQAAAKSNPKLRRATEGYLDFLRLGGKLYFEDLTPGLVRRHLTHGQPILTGLSSTYLHRSAREHGPHDDSDDIRGHPMGHFVVLCGYETGERRVTVADPLWPNPLAESHFYTVGIERVIGSILLGVLTYDANLLVLEPKQRRRRGG